MLVVAALLCCPVFSEEQSVTELSLDELANAEIISASKKAQPLSETAAAVFVITRETIRNSRAASIPELLRLVPGVNVGQIDANKWAVSIRGFNALLNKKLLVLIDGRPVYEHTRPAVHWETLPVPLTEIERIEVIRGPGGAIWGANAVNGIINIITRKTSDTLGGLLTANAGNVEAGFGSARYGASIGQNAFGRVYVRSTHRDESDLPDDGNKAYDSQRTVAGGFRVDWQLTALDSLTLHGDSYNAELDQISVTSQLTPPLLSTGPDTVHAHGTSTMARWNHTGTEYGDWSVQFFSDQTQRSEQLFDLRTETLDLEAQHRFSLSVNQELSWGGGYREIRSDLTGPNLSTEHGDRPFSIASAFFSDELSMLDDQVRLTIGAKWEDHERVGGNVQPSARAIWQISPVVSTWLAYSRAVRSPSRVDLDLELLAIAVPTGLPAPLPAVAGIFIVGNSTLDPETMTASELGIRWRASEQVAVDLAFFHHDYHDLIVSQIGAPFIDADLGIVRANAFPTNAEHATSAGAELAIHWLPTTYWSTTISYSYIDIDAGDFPTEEEEVDIEGNTPHQQVSLHNQIGLTDALSLSVWLRYRSALQDFSGELPARTDLDVDVGYQFTDQLKLWLVGKNLTGNEEADFFGAPAAQLDRSFYLSMRYEF